jgi:formylglycine-generating enzyme required for sulfatase activity
MSGRHRAVIAATVAVAVLGMSYQQCGKRGTPHPSEVRPQSDVKNKLGMRFVLVPGGTFTMGNEQFEDSRPRHRVRISPFYMMATEVTNRHYEAFRTRSRRGEYSPGTDEPVGELSRKEVLVFIAWLGKRDGRRYALPTEAQWEYAARGGIEGADYSWGNGIDGSQTLIGGTRTRPVASFAPNAYGLFDMTGNVGEMVHEAPYPYPRGEAVDPVYSDAGDEHIVRGLGVGPAMPWVWFRSSSIDSLPLPDVGFRIVFPLEDRRPQITHQNNRQRPNDQRELPR